VSLGITLVPLPVRRVALPRGELAYHDVPPPPGVPTVATAVLVPGYTGSKEDFALLAGPLSAAGVRYVALDQRGQYESPGPDDPAAYTVEALAGDLLDFLAALPPTLQDSAGTGARVHLVGHSFGGLVCRAAVLRDPSAVASLTLLGSGPAGLSGPRVEVMRALAPLLDSHGPEVLFEAILAGGPALPDGPLRAFLRERFLGSSVAGLRAMGEAVTEEPDRVAELRDSGIRTFVACGEGDDAWPPAVQQAMAAALGAPFAVIPGAVHSPAAEAPEATARVLLGFWAGA
jgi:pimeloyl-ACP methyl ester carboxylesterase